MTKEITISFFKARCLEIVNKLKDNNDSVIITKRNKPIAKIESIQDPSKKSIFALLKNKAEIKGDIVESINENWNCENHE